MQAYTRDGRTYRLAGSLNDFQRDLYMHLTDWKRARFGEECGYHLHKGQPIPYDVILPDALKKQHEPLYRPVVERVLEHQRRFPFKLHKFVGHMASSQVACINLFVPLLLHPETAAGVLRQVKPDLASIATDCLDQGFQIEFWPGKGRERGPLNDHTPAAGTDADIAIAYRDTEGRLKLWLIEHKLTEKEFTTCGGARSAGRKEKHRCATAADVRDNHDLCYYHEHCHYTYWPITARHPEVFPPARLGAGTGCPFKGGMNQLWRNVLLALAVEDATDSPFAEVHFSVVHHPGNHALKPSMDAFAALLGDKSRFSSFTADRIVNAVSASAPPELTDWAAWYKGLYRI